MNQRGFATLIILFIVAGLLLVGVGVWYYTSRNSKAIQPTSAQQTGTTSNQLASPKNPGWGSYQNTKYGFAFQYQPKYVYMEKERQSLLSAELFSMTVLDSTDPSKTVPALGVSVRKPATQPNGGVYNNIDDFVNSQRYVSSSQVSYVDLNGTRAAQYIYPGNGIGGPTDYFIVLNGTLIYEIYYDEANSSSFGPMVNTFSFTQPTVDLTGAPQKQTSSPQSVNQIPGWAVLQNKDLGFEIQYPPTFQPKPGGYLGEFKAIADSNPQPGDAPFNEMTIQVGITSYRPPPSSFDQVLALYESASAVTSTINGEPVIIFAKNVPPSDVDRLTLKNYIFYKNGLVYTLSTYYSSSTFADDLAKMANSFRFISGSSSYEQSYREQFLK